MADYSMKSVVVDTSQLSNGVEGRPNDISQSQVKRDLESAFQHVFANRKAGTQPVSLRVTVLKFHLSSRGAAMISPVPSQITAEIRLVNARTGADIFDPFVYSGASDYDLSQPVNPLSALTKLSVAKDYLDTVQSYAEQINAGFFGTTDAQRFPHPLSEPDS